MSRRSDLVIGLKLSHDAALTVMSGDEVIRSVELEKLGRRRYSAVRSSADLQHLVEAAELSWDRVRRVSVDGWHRTPDGLGHRLLDGIRVPQAGYAYRPEGPAGLPKTVRSRLPPPFGAVDVVSHDHVSGHIFGAWASSPFAADREPVIVLVWDGGMPAQAFLVHPAEGRCERLGHLFGPYLNVYSVMALHLPPFRRGDGGVRDRLDAAGKVMAFIATGVPDPEITSLLRRAWREIDRRWPQGSHRAAWAFSKRCLEYDLVRAASPADTLASLHSLIEQELVDALTRLVNNRARGVLPRKWKLCVAGGVGLNIKWNSALRRIAEVAEVWIPPFCNDSGSSLGQAVIQTIRTRGFRPIRWTLFAGPQLRIPPSTWARGREIDPAGTAALLARGEPVMLLQTRAELGPRALGHRSILADPRTREMLETLNSIKDREWYRPVAPVCPVEVAESIFDPGTEDPHMLFEHRVRDAWRDRVPAIVHLDGTARLQTLRRYQDPFLYDILVAFRRATGIGALCNTSANRKGRGFFHDLDDAIAWGGVRYIVADGRLFMAEAA